LCIQSDIGYCLYSILYYRQNRCFPVNGAVEMYVKPKILQYYTVAPCCTLYSKLALASGNIDWNVIYNDVFCLVRNLRKYLCRIVTSSAQNPKSKYNYYFSHCEFFEWQSMQPIKTFSSVVIWTVFMFLGNISLVPWHIGEALSRLAPQGNFPLCLSIWNWNSLSSVSDNAVSLSWYSGQDI
jgi:hypothetical protein